MGIRESMTAPVHSVQTTDAIAAAAKLMDEHDIGAVLVFEGEGLRGIVTDRDITIRGTARGLTPNLPIDRVMTPSVTTCAATDDVSDVLDLMARRAIRRIPVRSAQGDIVGMISLSDLARVDWDKEEIGTALCDICRADRIAAV